MKALLASLIKLALGVVRRLGNKAQQLYTERGAANSKDTVTQEAIIVRSFSDTLARLQGGTEDNAWFKGLHRAEGALLLSRRFFQREAVQVWLANEKIRNGLCRLALARLTGRSEDIEGKRGLCDSYCKIVNEPRFQAERAVDRLVDMLIAGCQAKLEPGQQVMVGLMLSETAALRKESSLDKQLAEGQAVQAVLTDRVRQELSRIRKLRSIDFSSTQTTIRSLAQAVTDGELSHASQEARAEVYYWAARLHAVQDGPLESAREFLEKLRQLDEEYPVHIVEALLAEAGGDPDQAIRSLRNIDDPDSRSTLLTILTRNQGAASTLLWWHEQGESDNPAFLTGLGWANLLATLAQEGQWDEALEVVTLVSEKEEEWPDLAFVGGVVNAALLLPPEHREHALSMKVFHRGVETLEGAEADERRKRAEQAFERAVTLMQGLSPDRAEAAKQWLYWLRLTSANEDAKNTCRREIQERLDDPTTALSVLDVALTFDVDFDASVLWHKLEQHSRLGGLEDHELRARFRLAEKLMNPQEVAEFLAEEEGRLLRVIPLEVLATKRVEALIRGGRLSQARTYLSNLPNDIDKDLMERLQAAVDQTASGDAGQKLRQFFEQSGAIEDLKNLVEYLHREGDWTGLLPHMRELFKRERTVKNVLRVVDCMFKEPEIRIETIVEFLSQERDLVDRDVGLQSALAWALSRSGRFQESRQINDELLASRDDPQDLHLDIDLAIQSGDWERFPSIVDREWGARESLEPDSLLRLAQIAAESDASADRAFELTKLAIKKESEDAELLSSAVGLAFRLGREGPEVHEWLQQAVEVSSDEGPFQQVALRELMEDWTPAHRERVENTNDLLTKGEIPLQLAAGQLSQPLFSILCSLPKENSTRRDGRRRVLIPTISGARPLRVDVDAQWTVGVDVTSLYVLAYLNALPRLTDLAATIVIPAGTMVFLLNERNRVRFHQPSLARAADEILELLSLGHLQVAEELEEAPSHLSTEVGADLGELLETARTTGGVVVRPLPIHRAGSYLEEEADLSGYEACIVSTVDFADYLRKSGYLDDETYRQAAQYLKVRDLYTDDTADLEVPWGPSIYCDDLALSYLQSAGLLQVLVRSGLRPYVHPRLKQEQESLRRQHRTSQDEARVIDELRLFLRQAVEHGLVEYLPWRRFEDDGQVGKAMPTLAQFLKDSSPCDAVCVDDRFLNRYPLLTDEEGHRPQVLCSQDLLSAFKDRETDSKGPELDFLHRLRAGGYALTRVSSAELVDALERSSVDDKKGTLLEHYRLRVIRQYLARVRSLRMIQAPSETSYIAHLIGSGFKAIRALWLTESIELEQAVLASTWVLEHVIVFPGGWMADPVSAESLEEVGSRELVSLLSIVYSLSETRTEVYRDWLDQRVIKQLLPARSSIVDRVSEAVVGYVTDWSEEVGEELRDASHEDSDS